MIDGGKPNIYILWKSNSVLVSIIAVVDLVLIPCW